MTLCLKPICSMVLVHQHLPQQIHPNADKYTIRHTWSIWVTSLPSKTWELTNCTKNDTIVRTHWVVTGMLQGGLVSILQGYTIQWGKTNNTIDRYSRNLTNIDLGIKTATGLQNQLR